MRTYSTPESALNLEITKLAIVECVVAVSLYVGAGIYFGTFKYLALAVVFAPLMLFRTEVSALWGLDLYSRTLTQFERLPQWLYLLLIIGLAPLIGPVIRVVATLFWLIRRPLYTFNETPRNWLRQTVCTDFAHVPEVIPLEALRDDFHVPTFARYVAFLKEEERFERYFIPVLFLPFVLIGWLPSLLYRISFKATSLVYAPLIWVTHLTLQNPLPLKARLERITKGELEKLRRGLSWVILGSGIAKLALIFGWIDLSDFVKQFPSAQIANKLVIVDRWPWWQFTLIVDALLTFFLFFFADAAITRIENQQTWKEDFVTNVVTSASFLRAVLGIVTISYFFYRALLIAFPALWAA